MAHPLRIVLPDCLQKITDFGAVIHRANGYNAGISDEVYLDLQSVRFISPYGLLGLLLLGKKLFGATGNKSSIIDTTYKLSQYLERMNFFKVGHLWFKEPDISDKFSRSEKTTSLLEIQKIGTVEKSGKVDVDDIAETFRKRASNILGVFEAKMDVNFFIKVMSELCTNIYTHSKSDGYVAIQRYDYEKSGFEVVKLSVMDDGIGIKKSLRQRKEFIFPSECEYIIKALEPNVSGAGDRGFGLYEVKSIVEKSSGYLWINSGDSAILIEPGERKIKKFFNLPFLQGTRIAIILAFEKLSFQLDNENEDSLNF